MQASRAVWTGFFQKVLETLTAKNLLEDTLIVWTAYHGEELLDHGFVGHTSTSLQAKLYEELIHPWKWPTKWVWIGAVCGAPAIPE